MELQPEIESDRISDPSWSRAKDVVIKQMSVPSHLSSLMRSSWGHIPLDKNLLHYISSTTIGAGLLFDVAQPEVFGDGSTVVSGEDALKILGPKLVAAILTVNFTCRLILRHKPPATWERLFKEMMLDIEIGVAIGRRIPSIGPEGGIAIGFSKRAALCFLMTAFPKLFAKWYLNHYKSGSRDAQIDIFGCEYYQVSAFILQQLGFGSEVAVGAALGMGAVDSTFLTVTDETRKWKAGFLWFSALKHGRSFPADPKIRDFFPELKLGQNRKNTMLEVLYTEVATVQRDGGQWTWHLPRPSYEQTQVYLENEEWRKTKDS
ncbi:MAG: hypothetical protein KDD53_09580 [Bdellovibrionales bacterium]|nr:hypothetical protein [Bdellovibrionales bacterium]